MGPLRLCRLGSVARFGAGSTRAGSATPRHVPSFNFQKEDTLAAARSTAKPEPVKTQLEQLAAEFPGSAVKTRAQAGQTLTYISIDGTINRLNDVLGPNWSTNANTEITVLADGQFLAVCHLTLSGNVDGVYLQKYGVGADKGKDVDKIAKTALAEALKKAGHQLGIALYLWDADGRSRAETRMKLDKSRDSEATLKRAVFDLAKQKGSDVTSAADVAKVFGVKPGDLADKASLVRILEGEGVL